MYELIVERSFSSAHRLRDYDGPCARVHGHNYRVEVGVGGDELVPNGFLLDFGDLKVVLDEVLDAMDHRMLNELEPFANCNPTSENIARYIHGVIGERLPSPGLRVTFVRVWETDGQSAVYREG